VEASLDSTEAQEYVETVTPHLVPDDLPLSSESVPEFEFENEVEEDLAVLENQAHAQRVLLSSDAMRYFVGKAASLEDRPALLDQVIAKARVTFPSEDGWVVINLVRMEQLLEEIDKTDESAVADQEIQLEPEPVPTHSGSLAEAILGGNVVAAFEMISNRPMVALADAAADLDALYRMRRGEQVAISDLLKKESLELSLEQLQKAIAALTGALDGTYTDEASAVRMAIMKAIKEVTS